MLDLGWTEILIILVLGLLVVGPKELPKLVRTLGKWRGKMSAYARDFQRSIEDAADVSEIDAIKKEIAEANRELSDANRDLKESASGIHDDMQRATKDTTVVRVDSEDAATEAGAPDAQPSRSASEVNPGNGEAQKESVAEAPTGDPTSAKTGESRENSANA